MYKEIVRYQALINPSIVLTTTGAKAIVTTDPNMRFQIYDYILELVAVSGLTSVPSGFTIGTNASSYNDQVSAPSLSGITTVNQFAVGSAGGATATSIAPNTTIYLNVTGAAVATTYNVRVILCGIYY